MKDKLLAILMLILIWGPLAICVSLGLWLGAITLLHLTFGDCVTCAHLLG